MQKKIIAVILALLLFAPLLSNASADSSSLCFTATNDTLLDLGSMASVSGGIVYVPCKVFSAFGVYFNYFEAKSTALLYNGSKQIFFEMTSGNSYDSEGTPYSVSAMFRNGQVYVPVQWVSDYFGLSYSYISGVGYGDVARIKNGGQVLSDSQFLDAANSLMKNRYKEYYGMVDPSSPTPSSPTSGSDASSKASLSLSFIGLPSDKTLDSLDSYSVNACFFVTAEQAASSPDLIRRICGSGHSIGIYCETSPESECKAAADSIFEAAQFRPTLVSSAASISKSCTAYAAANGYAYFTPKIQIAASVKASSAITAKLDGLESYTSLCAASTENADSFLQGLLQYIGTKKISVLPLRETFV